MYQNKLRIFLSCTVTHILSDHSVHSSHSPVCACVRANSTDVDTDCNINVRTCTRHVTENSKYVEPSTGALSCGSAMRYIAELEAPTSKTDTYMEGSDEDTANIKLYLCAC
jgi:hypothetical protein